MSDQQAMTAHFLVDLYPGAKSLERVVMEIASVSGVADQLKHALLHEHDPIDFRQLMTQSLVALHPTAPPVSVAFTLSQHSSQAEVSARNCGVVWCGWHEAVVFLHLGICTA